MVTEKEVENVNYIDITKNFAKNNKSNSHKILDKNYFKDSKGFKYKVDGKNVVLDYSKKYNKKVFDRYIVTCLIYALFEGIIFILLPTTMTREPLVVDSISTWIINIIYKVDTPVNLFPSAHCALAILFIISTLDVKEIKKEYKILITITSVLIMLSTVFIKQHVIVDVLGAFIIVPMYYIIRKKKINLEESGIYAKIFCQKKRTK